MRTWTARSISAIAVVGALALAGCNGGGDDPTTSTTSSSSSSTTSSPSSTTTASPSTTTSATIDPAKLPPEATEKTEAGAKAFAEFYLSELSAAGRSGDTKLVRSLTAQACKACHSFLDAIDDRTSDGQKLDRDSLSIDDATVLSMAGDKTAATVGVLATDATKRVVDRDGSPVKTIQGAKINFEVSVRWREAVWVVEGLVAK